MIELEPSLRDYDEELRQWQAKQRASRETRLAPVRQALVSALFQYPQTRIQLEDIVRDVCEPPRGYMFTPQIDIFDSIVDLLDTNQIRIRDRDIRRGITYELLPAVATSLWELPQASPTC